MSPTWSERAEKMSCGHARSNLRHSPESATYCQGCVDEAQRPLPDAAEARTETLLDYGDSDVQLLCGCRYWRMDREPEDSFHVTWCRRHLPAHLQPQPERESCPQAGCVGHLIPQASGGVNCDTCPYWFCY